MDQSAASRDHAPFGDLGSELVYGRRADGDVVHVSRVASGLGCDCACPACGARLVARKGEVTRHHFAHHAEGTACRHAAETNLHAMAKDILARERRLVFPRTIVDVGGERGLAFKGGEVRFDAVRLERRLGLVVPDVVLTVGGRELVVEVFVTHRCDDDKVAKLRAAEVASLEVDLGGCRGMAPADVARALVETAPRRWLFNRRIEAARRRLEDRLSAREAEAAMALGRRVAEVRAALAGNPARPGCRLRDEAGRLAAVGLLGPTHAPVPGEAGFLCTAQDWKVALLTRWVLPALDEASRPADGGRRSLPEVFRLVEDLVAPACRRPMGEQAREAVLVVLPDLCLPFWAVRSFVGRLEGRGVLLRTGDGRWRVAHGRAGTASAVRRSVGAPAGARPVESVPGAAAVTPARCRP